MSLTTRKGGIFKGKGVWQILQNEKYIGVQTNGKKEWYKDGDNKAMCKDRQEKDWIVYQDAHEPIIDNDTFESVKAMMDTNRTVPIGTRKHIHTLTGLVKCGKCGWNMALIKRSYPSKTVFNIRSCFRKDYLNGVTCSNKGIEGDVAEEFIVKAIFGTVRPVILDMKKTIAKGGKFSKKAFEGQELDELFKQEKQLNQQMDKLIEMQLEFKTDRVSIKMKQVEAQLGII